MVSDGCLASHTPLRRVWLVRQLHVATRFMRDHTAWCPSEAAHWLGLGLGPGKLCTSFFLVLQNVMNTFVLVASYEYLIR